MLEIFHWDSENFLGKWTLLVWGSTGSGTDARYINIINYSHGMDITFHCCSQKMQNSTQAATSLSTNRLKQPFLVVFQRQLSPLGAAKIFQLHRRHEGQNTFSGHVSHITRDGLQDPLPPKWIWVYGVFESWVLKKTHMTMTMIREHHDKPLEKKNMEIMFQPVDFGHFGAP